MNYLESYFLDIIEFSLFIGEQEFSHYFQGLRCHVLEKAKI
jgi:hypothetical protein